MVKIKLELIEEGYTGSEYQKAKSYILNKDLGFVNMSRQERISYQKLVLGKGKEYANLIIKSQNGKIRKTQTLLLKKYNFYHKKGISRLASNNVYPNGSDNPAYVNLIVSKCKELSIKINKNIPKDKNLRILKYKIIAKLIPEEMLIGKDKVKILLQHNPGDSRRNYNYILKDEVSFSRKQL
ncbi:MAG: hypothetical protein Q9M94_04975 [Candidatus Gracilibacteria bacterium]|nr:hypothetical protein [Candidatus Gracilibacteria bacterium]